MESSIFQPFAIGIISLIIFYILKRPRIGENEPPFVPYTIPILGHTYDYLFNTKNFIRECNERYGECFSIYVFGRVMTIVARNSMNEVFRNQENFDTLFEEVVPFHLLFKYSGGLHNVRQFSSDMTRKEISGKFDVHCPTVEKYLLKGIDNWIGDCKEPKVFQNFWMTANYVIALPMVTVLVGEEAGSHEDIVKSLGNLAFDLGSIMAFPPVLGFIHQKLHEFAISLPLRIGWNPMSLNRKILINRVKPVIEKRLEEKKELGDDYKPYTDTLEHCMSQPDFSKKFLYYIDNLLLQAFSAITSSSKTATNALYDMASRPECFNELYEEALMIDVNCNGSVTLPDIQKMEKLDSFIKESLRHSDEIVNVNLAHQVISESYTFSNGYTIPKGRMANIYSYDSLKSKEAYGEDAEEFKPFRFVNKNSPATKVDRSYVIFGGGRHACPGRFFAINATKLILHKLILKYNITTKSGKIENKVVIGPMTLPPRGDLVFENRKQK